MVLSACGFGDRPSGQLKIELPSRSIRGHYRNPGLIQARTRPSAAVRRMCLQIWGSIMNNRGLLALIAFALTLILTPPDAQAWADSNYPDLTGQCGRSAFVD